MTPQQRTSSGILPVLAFVIIFSLTSPVQAADPIWNMSFPEIDSHQGFNGIAKLSPDNQYLVASNPDGSEIFTVLQNGTLLWKYTPEKTTEDWKNPVISGIAISSDNSLIGISVMLPGCCRGIVTETPSNQIILFDTGGHMLWNYSTREPPQSIAISKNGRDIFVGYETRSLSCLNRDGTLRWNSPTDSPISRIEISADGEHILASGINVGGQYTNDVFFFTNDGVLLWKKQFRGENILGISPDEQNLMISGYPAQNTFSLNTGGKILWEHSFADIGTVMALATNGRYVLAGTNDHVQMLDNRGEKLWDYKTTEPVYSVSLSGNGDIIGAGTGTDLIVLNRTGTLLWRYTTNETIIPVAVSDDGAYIAAISDRLYLFNSQGNLSIIKPSQGRTSSIFSSGSPGSLPTAKPAAVPLIITIFASALGATGAIRYLRK
ncbi:MAG: WD40 repeat domain-containing protein [Methanoregula sp.]|uniref:WD40 repeat domain-containing protein n=1 Tax=Methanoregula sp. TaxID=2052170 RepID=UPI0025F339F6|nr:WD40 repeat domain-containing protein [Methanoregula sp.]MCK9632556.1 WD40 repeat domain-containing protein [Methanoregula sp.]